MKNFTFIDLFSGLGGFRIALQNLGGSCLMSSDIDEAAREVYKKNFGDYPRGNVEEIESAEVPAHDILCAGFPCQPFSIAGRRLGFEDTRGTLFFQVARIAKDKQPKIVFLENVAGIKSHDSGNTLKVIEETMNDVGYNFYHTLMNAKHHGIPQNRNRWYGVGFRKDLNIPEFTFPSRTSLSFSLLDIIQDSVDESYSVSKTARTHINTFLPPFMEGSRYDSQYPVIANEVRPSRCGLSSTGICPCLTAKMGTGGNNVPIVVSQMRQFTERECLDVMGYPKTYQLGDVKTQSYKQIGNSVCVPVIQQIGKCILDTMSKFEKE